jgi:RNA polymerase sigma-70 factor (ECF subfamily)
MIRPGQLATEKDAGAADPRRRALAEHRAAFVEFVRRRVHDPATAEDLVNDTLARALSHLGELRDEGALLAWLYRALRNAVVDHRRRLDAAQRARERWAAETDATVAAHEHAPPRICPCVTRVAASLKPEYAEVLARVEVDGAAVGAFAEERGISSSNAAVRLFRARGALRRRVAATCGACADGGCVDCTCHPPAAGVRTGP